MISDRKQQISQRVLALAGLESGWHFGRGEKLSDAVLTQLLEAAQTACEFGFSAIDVVPGAGGEVQLVASEAGGEIEMTIEKNGMVSLVRELEGEELVSLDPFASAMEKFREYSSQICSGSFDSSIQSSTWKNMGAIPASHSAMAEGPEYQSLTINASPTGGLRLASIFESITQQVQESLQFIGSSTVKKSRARFVLNTMPVGEIPAITTCMG